MSKRSSKSHDTETNVVYMASHDALSGITEEPSCSDWSSYEELQRDASVERNLIAKRVYSPGNPDICTRYIPMSDSDVYNHVHYDFLSVPNPGIEEALLEPEPLKKYPDDGREFYQAMCAEMNIGPIRLFYDNLLKEEINLSYYGISEKSARAMAMALRYNRYVQKLNLSYNFLKDEACFHLGEMFQTNCTLKELNLAGCRIGFSGMERLGMNFNINRSLRYINLSKNWLADEGGALFIDLMFYGATLERVNLSDNALNLKTADKLTFFMSYKNCLTHLDISWNTFTHPANLQAMLNHIGDSERMEVLNLSWNSLHGIKVAHALQKILLIPTLRVLNLSNNQLHGESINLIIASLPKAKRLRIFDLSFNPLSLEDAISVIMKMLRPRVKVQQLLLENICVNNQFITILNRVRKMKSRVNFEVTYGDIVRNYQVEEPDPRRIILRRAQYLGHNVHPRHKVDVAVFFLKLSVEFQRSIMIEDLLDRTEKANVPLDEDLVTELSYVFPGSKIAGSRSVNLNLIKEYISRLWPDKRSASPLHTHAHHGRYSKSRLDVFRNSQSQIARKSKDDNADIGKDGSVKK